MLAETVDDHRNAHLQDQARQARRIPGDIPVEKRPRAQRNRDENIGAISFCGGSQHILFYARLSGSNQLESVLMPMLEKYDVVLVEDPEGMVHW